MVKLSIIVPVYNVEKYIRSCVESIFHQELSDECFELILVNDGTKDDSFKMIEDIVANHSNIVVVEQDNQGLSVARNSGLKRAKGLYVLFLDSDDLLIEGSLTRLLDLALESLADLVIAEFIKMNDDEILPMSVKANQDVIVENKTGRDVFLNNFNPGNCYVWRTLYRKEFLSKNRLCFIPNLYFEDIPFTTECYLNAQNCIVTNSVFYIYRQRENSIVSTINMRKLIDMNKILEYLWNMKFEMQLTPDVYKQLMNVIFVTFSIAIWYISHDKMLLRNRREFVMDLKSRIPELEFTNGIKQRLVSILFKYIPCTYIRLRAALFC